MCVFTCNVYHHHHHHHHHHHYLIVSKSLKVLIDIMKLQNIKSYDFFFSGSELLNEDTRTDRQGKTEMCYFEGFFCMIYCLLHYFFTIVILEAFLM